MHKDDEVRLRHMLDAAEEAIGFAHGRVKEDLSVNRMLVLSLVKDIEIIGEAARKVSVGAQEALPQIPWQDVIGMRHRLIHAYFDVNLDVVWKTVSDDLPMLVGVLRPILLSR